MKQIQQLNKVSITNNRYNIIGFNYISINDRSFGVIKILSYRKPQRIDQTDQ